MTVEDKTSKDKKFEPVTIQIRFESQQEVNSFYHRINVSSNELMETIRESNDISFDSGKSNTSNNQIFNLISKYAK